MGCRDEWDHDESADASEGDAGAQGVLVLAVYSSSQQTEGTHVEGAAHVEEIFYERKEVADGVKCSP